MIRIASEKALKFVILVYFFNGPDLPECYIRLQPSVVIDRANLFGHPGFPGRANRRHMSFLIGRYDFEGPMINWMGVNPVPGIYAILSFAHNEFELVDIAESENLQAAFQNPQKLAYWQSRSNGMLTFSVYYHPRASKGRREEIVHEILREFDCEGFCRTTQTVLAPLVPALVPVLV